MKDLKQCMNEQLNVFLGAQTDPFLERLFVVIANEEYLKVASINNGTTSSSTAATINAEQNQLSQDLSTAHELNASIEQTEQLARQSIVKKSTNEQLETDTDNVNSSPLGTSITKLRDVSPISPVKSGGDNEHHRRREERRRDRSRSRSRSRQHNRDSRDNRGRHLAYRNKSPLDGDRRKSNPFRRNSGHEPKSPKYYNRSDSPIENDEPKGARSLSPISKNDRCRDFDEKGYCMRGETCPWDHGINPVVLEDLNNSTLMSIQTPHIRSGNEYNPDVPEIWPQGAGFLNGPNRAALPNAPFPMPLGAAASAYRVPPFSVPLGMCVHSYFK